MTPTLALAGARVLTAPGSIDSDQARRELSDELWNPAYIGTWWDRFQAWVTDLLLMSPGDADLSWVFLVLAGLAVLALGVAVAVLMRRRTRRSEQAEDSDAVFDGEHVLTAQEYRTRAAEHVRAGRYDAAAIDRYRAIGADAVDAGLVADSPELTAHEVGAALVRSYPDHAGRARDAGILFDLVRYGGGHAGAEDVEGLTALDDDLRHSTPMGHGQRETASAVPR